MCGVCVDMGDGAVQRDADRKMGSAGAHNGSHLQHAPRSPSIVHTRADSLLHHVMSAHVDDPLIPVTVRACVCRVVKV